MPLMDLPCNKIISSKRRIISRLIKTTDYPLEGITGFLFLEDALINPTYQYINHAPEFLIDLDNCISGILKEWQNSSEQLIVKCEADLTSWYCPGDNKQEESPSKKSYKIGIEAFDYLAKLYGKNYRFSLGKKSPDYYPFISYGNGIPAEKIIEIISPSSR